MCDKDFQSEKKYLLSVVIPTIGRASLIKTIRSLYNIKEVQNIEIIVVGEVHDEHIRAQLDEFVASNTNIRHIKLAFTAGDSSHKKNVGWQSASADLIAFIDDDVLLDELWVLKIIEPFHKMNASLVSGPSLLPADTNFIGRLAAETLSSLAAGYVAWRYSSGRSNLPYPAKWSHLIGCNMAYKRNVLDSIGGFNPSFWPGEEMLAAFQATKAGHILIFNPEAKVYHYPRSTISGFCKQMYGYGATRIRLIRAGVEVEISTLVPVLFIVANLVLLLFSLFFKMAGIFFLCLWMLYLFGAIVITLIKMFETCKVENAAILPMIILMHVSYGVGELFELFFPDKDLSLRDK